MTKDAYNKRFDATHYSLSPNRTMTKADLCRLLDQLAINAQARKAAAGRG